MFGETLGNRIGAIKRLPHDQNDSLVWKEAADGTFTVKRGCIATQRLWKQVWGKEVHSRHSMMIWRVITGCVPTGDKLGFVGDLSCPFCDNNLETECPCARALWFSGPFPMCFGEGSGDSPKRRLSWILSSLPTELVDRVFTFIGCLFEGIWNARNEFLFKECLILANADLDMGQSITAEVPRGAIGSNGQAFCVTDASWKDGVAGLAVGVLERQSNTSWWFARNATASSAAEAELLAIQWALQIAGQRDFKSFACASDAKVLVSALNERKFPPMWTLKPLALEPLSLDPKDSLQVVSSHHHALIIHRHIVVNFDPLYGASSTNKGASRQT
ncbi:hypothetical protein G4B88_022106 [Cannabis sativa]|uniref:RNase H type-1 domain-containing protein n=1 Tax=Cannabis sativa TaxID=3483 RepID=A0A7J6EYV8_CANSA|nr:hypothetical protein G4B88_022106 [Cannabis sativa]